MSALRGALVLTGFAGLTLPLMPLQAAFKRLSPKLARTFPHWYHKRVCRLIGVRIEQSGKLASGRPVLIVANHVSWLDIPVLSAVAPVSFIAKKEVGGWPGVSALANLQRTVFVDREKRLSVGATAQEVSTRLSAGDNLVLFAEGTSTDGNRVLPFRTSLFAAVKPGRRRTDSTDNTALTAPSTVAPHAEPDEAIQTREKTPVVQTLTIVYKRLHGVPLGRHDRPLIGWYGDMDMVPHAWQLLKAGPVDVAVHIGDPMELSAFEDRKDLAQHTEKEIRTTFQRLLRGPRERDGN